MGKIELIERIKQWIAVIGWNLFIWGNNITEEEYWQRIYEQEKAYLEGARAESSDENSGLNIPVVMASDSDDKGWTGNYVKCDLCGFKWVAVYHESCDKLECKQCGNMVRFHHLP